MKTRTLLNAVVCASALTLGPVCLTSALAQNAAPTAQVQQGASQEMLSIRDVYDLLEKQGYRNITEIELKRRGREYEVKADNASRNYVKLYVDAYSGRILSERRKYY